jgi:hypothetical protein
MDRKTVIIVALQAFIIIVLFWLLVFYGKDEYEAATSELEEEIESVSHVVTGDDAEDGAAVIRLSVASQQLSGLTTATLQPVSFQAQASFPGMVIGIEPLMELRTRYVAARADASVAAASLTNSKLEYQRMLQLNADDKNISDRALAIAESSLKADQARTSAAEATANNIRDNIRQQWGSTLANWASSSSGNEAFSRLLQYQDVLLQITVPFTVKTPGKDIPLFIEPVGGKGQVSKAAFISASPQTDPTLQGKTYFYRAAADNLRAGMRVIAKATSSDKASAGVIIPDTAVVWYANKAWVYEKQGVDKFIRRPISTETEASNQSGSGWFNTELKPGDQVVNSGAQLLLSEEFKYQITNENDD